MYVLICFPLNSNFTLPKEVAAFARMFNLDPYFDKLIVAPFVIVMTACSVAAFINEKLVMDELVVGAVGVVVAGGVVVVVVEVPDAKSVNVALSLPILTLS